MNYNNYLKSKDWKNKKSEKYLKLKRKWKKPRCAICWYDDLLEVHHLYYEDDLTKNKSDSLRILCRTCHQTTHDLINEWVLVIDSKSHHSIFTKMKNMVKVRLWYKLNESIFWKITNN